MNTVKLMAMASAVVLGVSGLALAQATKPAGKPPEKAAEKAADKGAKGVEKAAAKAEAKKGGLHGEYLTMAKEVNLSADQQAKLEEAINARAAALNKWEGANAAKEKQLRTSLQEARAGSDKAKATALSAELDALVKPREEIKKKGEADIDAILTPEQRQQWEAYELFSGVKKNLAKANLTDAQLADIKARCQGTAAALTKATDPKDKAKITASLRDAINAQVLTAEQRTALGIGADKPKAKAPAAAPAAAKPETKKTDKK